MRTDLFSIPEPASPGRELVVDSFAGGGGASTGIALALGRGPDIAINHDADALALHAANHPETLHVSKNIWQVDPLDLCRNRPVGLAWFSPDCKHFSKAKGGRPVKRNIRDLAWVVVLWAKRVRPRVILLENVEEFRDWGPIGRDGRPCAERKGETFARWIGELRRLGYRVEHRELRACDYGAPTTRKRLFLIARRDGRPIVWPEPTHGRPDHPDVVSGRLEPWRSAAEIIDWSLPCPSIFLTREEGRAAGCNRPLAEATMARIAKGVKRYVIDAARPFIVNLTHAGGERCEDPGAPLRTITGANRGEKAVVAPIVSYAQQGGGNRDSGEPLHTVTASPKDQNCLVAAHLMTMRNAAKPHNEADRPAHTITAGGAGLSLVAAHMASFRGSGEGRSLDDPAPTVTANSFVKRPGGAPPQAVVAAFLAQHNEGPRPGAPGREAAAPVSTLTSTGSQQSLVASFLSHAYTSNTCGGNGDLNHPKKTVLAGGSHAAEVRAFLMKYYGPAIGQEPEGPLHTATAKARFGLVMVEGEAFQIVDIGMRMLSPRELFRAQGFPDDYVIDRRADGTRLTKTAQIRMVGNSVCPPLAEALVRANYAAAAIAESEAAA